MVDVSNQFQIIQENEKKLNNFLRNDYRNNLEAGNKALNDSKKLISYNNQLVSF